MKVTLNKAVKFRNLLMASLSGFAATMGMSVRMESEIQVMKDVQEASEASQQGIDAYVRDKGSLYALRSLIHQNNVSSGADDLINQMALRQDIISTFSRQNRHYFNGKNVASVVDEMNYRQELAKSKEEPYRTMTEAIQITGPQEKIETLMSKTRKELAVLEEDRNRINHNHMVEIPEDIIETLRSRDII